MALAYVDLFHLQFNGARNIFGPSVQTVTVVLSNISEFTFSFKQIERIGINLLKVFRQRISTNVDFFSICEHV